MRLGFLAICLCLCLLVGCSALTPLSALPAALGTNLTENSISQIAVDNIVIKLFPMEGEFTPRLFLDALADEGAIAAFGEALEGLEGAEPYIAGLCDYALESAQAFSGDTMENGQDFLQQMLLSYCDFPAFSCERAFDGRIFVSNAQLSSLMPLFHVEDMAALPLLSEDAGNGGYLFEGKERDGERSYIIKNVLGSFEGASEGEMRIDVELRQAGETVLRVLIDAKVDEASPFGFRASSVQPFSPQDSQGLSFFSYTGVSIALDTPKEAPQLGLSFMTGEGLYVETSEGSATLSILPKGTKMVSSGRAGGYEPRAQLFILVEEDDGFKPEASAEASAAAAQAGYALEGMELHDLVIRPSVFLGRENAYVLKYIAVDVDDESGAMKEEIEHYILKGGNGGFYHFIFCFRPGVEALEQQLLREAAAAISFVELG